MSEYALSIRTKNYLLTAFQDAGRNERDGDKPREHKLAVAGSEGGAETPTTWLSPRNNRARILIMAPPGAASD